MLISDNQSAAMERRKGEQRRFADLGVPAGMTERRVNIERRLFNLDVTRLDDWLGNPANRVNSSGS